MTSVLVTRAIEGAERQAGWLEEAGFRTAICPLVATEPVPGPTLDVSEYDWLILTSRSGVEYARARLTGPWPNTAAVGPGTAEALRDAGVVPALVPRRHSQAGLVEAFPEEPGRVLFAGAEGARTTVVSELGAEFLPLYRTRELQPDELPETDLVVLSSGSAARALARLGREAACVSIGPSTSEAAAEVGLLVLAEAGSADQAGLVAAVTLAASRLPS